MKLFRHIAAASCLLLGGATSVLAQTSVSPALVERKIDGRIVQPEQPAASPANVTAVARPDRVERALPADIKARVQQFEAAREAFIRRQEELRKKRDGATTDKERDAIRQRMQESLDQWREQAKQFRDEARERLRELQREVPSLREVLREGPTADGVKPGKPGRPGTD